MRKRHGIIQTPWWGIPTRNTLDRATAMLPRLLYERLDELGLDVAVLYPTYGLIPIHITDDELRQAMAAAFNEYLAEQYAPYADRLIPVACIPTFTPEEALAELEHAVVDLGLRAVMMGGAIPRPIPEGGPGAIWMDGLGHGSLYDYDPLWRRCVELGGLPNLPFDRLGMGLSYVDEQLRLQPHRQLRCRRRIDCSLAPHGWGAAKVPRTPLRLPGRRHRLGLQPLQRRDRALGEAQCRSGEALRPGRARPQHAHLAVRPFR